MRIIELWLDREGYDKIARWVHHSPQSVQRYVSTFVRVVILQREGRPVQEIAFLTRSTERLVRDYLALYAAAMGVAHRREKLAEELERRAVQFSLAANRQQLPRLRRAFD